MSYPAQITILSMRHDTTLPPTLKQTYKSISKVHKLIRVHTHTHIPNEPTQDKHTSMAHIHTDIPTYCQSCYGTRTICVMWLLLVLK